ncbi:MAG: gliding motility lipoprotein GldH [Prevotella sp.]|nr:gliding motility lipoprotein GldH [Prevotella sp.]
MNIIALTKRNRWICFLAVALAMASCNRQTVYSHYEPIATEGWERNDSICFVMADISEEGVYSQTVGLRADNAYPYKNLTLIVCTEVWRREEGERRKTEGERRRKEGERGKEDGEWRLDTLNFQITDDDGNILGSGMNHYQYEMTLPSITLHRGDSLRMSVSHLMRRECLPGITDLGYTARLKSEE